ncbi:MAG: methyltransferase domain-containing protein [Verrucomicrobiota bacterium]
MRQKLKCLAGSVLHHLIPPLAREVDQGNTNDPHGRLKQLIADYQISRAAASGNASSLRRNLTHYWKSARGDGFYDAYPERFEEWFLGHHYSVVEALARELEKRPEIHRLIEVGCGDGKVLQHLSDRFSTIDAAIGIDLNHHIVERNREVYRGTNLRFECTDLHLYLKNYQGSGILLVSNGGVFEYLTQTELEDLFTSFKNLASPVMLMLVEPIAADFDLKTETTSRPHGIEKSFSHPHRYLLEKSGWKVNFEEVQDLEHRWMLMVASA